MVILAASPQLPPRAPPPASSGSGQVSGDRRPINGKVRARPGGDPTLTVPPPPRDSFFCHAEPFWSAPRTQSSQVYLDLPRPAGVTTPLSSCLARYLPSMHPLRRPGLTGACSMSLEEPRPGPGAPRSYASSSTAALHEERSAALHEGRSGRQQLDHLEAAASYSMACLTTWRQSWTRAAATFVTPACGSWLAGDSVLPELRGQAACFKVSRAMTYCVRSCDLGGPGFLH